LNQELDGYGDRSDMQTLVDTEVPRLNVKQKTLYDDVMSAVEADVQHPEERHGAQFFFMDGQGGGGKTHVLKLLLAAQRAKGRVALATATSGIAALLLPGGCTGPLDA
jgi:primosomal protein N'